MRLPIIDGRLAQHKNVLVADLFTPAEPEKLVKRLADVFIGGYRPTGRHQVETALPLDTRLTAVGEVSSSIFSSITLDV